VIILGMMQVSKRIPFEDPQVLMGVRILYVVSNLIIFGMYFYISTKIKAKRGMPQTQLTAKESRS
jgi:tRNA U54 and U55 pseudouridine synthase Pus10